MMWLLPIYILIGLIVVTWVLWNTAGDEIWTHIMIAITVMYVGFLVLGLPIGRSDWNAEIAQYKAVKQTLTLVKTRSSAERTALVLQMVETNKQVAEMKYYNSTWFWDIFVPDEADNLKLLK